MFEGGGNCVWILSVEYFSPFVGISDRSRMDFVMKPLYRSVEEEAQTGPMLSRGHIKMDRDPLRFSSSNALGLTTRYTVLCGRSIKQLNGQQKPCQTYGLGMKRRGRGFTNEGCCYDGVKR